MSSDPHEPTPARFWADTNVATELFEPASARGPVRTADIGEPVGRHVRELFVSCDPAQALRMQLEQSGLRYMAIADLGGGRARRGLLDISRASGWPVQRLVVRRQGYGDTLATLYFLDSPTQDGGSVRVFCADVDAGTDEVARVQLGLMLMARAELVALLVPDQSASLRTQATETLRQEIRRQRTGWLCRNLIFMPAKTSPEFVNEITRFRAETGIPARMAPAVRRADQLWIYLGSTWNQMQDRMVAGQRLILRTLALVASPAAGGAELRAESLVVSDTGLLAQRCVHHLLRQPGVQRVCLFNLQSQAVVAHSGTPDEAQAMAVQGRALLQAMGRAGEVMALGHALVEASFTLTEHRVQLRGMALLPGCVMHVVLARNAPPLRPLPGRAQLEAGA
ncbi:MAG: hypothetical protein ACK4MG_09010 [Aquabacterium sp.]